MATGKAKNFQWDYSKQSDIFNIHKKSCRVFGSAELGDFTIDFDSVGNIIGLEIMNVTDFMNQIGLSGQLEHLKEAELIIKPGKEGNVTYILLRVVLHNAVDRVIPIPAPVMAKA